MSLRELLVDVLAKELSDEQVTSPRSPFTIGQAVFIRTVTMHHTGRVDYVDDDFVYLTDAAWVANSGRWNEALETGKLSEVEPFPNGVWVARQAVVDVALWNHGLPSEVC